MADGAINAGKGAIFDLDGTLLDSMGVWDQVDIDFLGRRGIPVPPDYMVKVASMQFQQIAEYTIARFGLPDTPDQLMREWDDMARVAYSTVVEAKPHAREYLTRLRASGAKLAVATSLPPALREPAMKACSSTSPTPRRRCSGGVTPHDRLRPPRDGSWRSEALTCPHNSYIVIYNS